MKFIKLTNVSASPSDVGEGDLYVNPYCISRIVKDKDFINWRIKLTDLHYWIAVKETPEQILKMIKENKDV